MKYCARCGKQLQDDMLFCPFCGQNSTSGYAQPYAQPQKNDGLAVGSMICGILSMIFGLIPGIIAIVLANMSKKENGGIMPPMAKVGYYMGLVLTILTGVLILLLIVLYVGVLGLYL